MRQLRHMLDGRDRLGRLARHGKDALRRDRRRLHGLLNGARQAGERFKEVGSVIWRCFYSITLTGLGVIGLVLVPQGAESLRLASQPGWNFSLFLFSVATWSLAAWYSARLVLGRVFDGTSVIDRHDTVFVNGMRLWIPRALGVVPGAVLALQFYRIGHPLPALACMAATTAIGVFVVKRRTWFAAGFGANGPILIGLDGGSQEAGDPATKGRPRAVRFGALQQRSVLTVTCALCASFALLFAIWWRPVEVTALVTAPVLLCFALASWILFGDLVLTYFFKQAKLPSMTAAPLFLFVVCSLWNDNHAVALIPGDQGPVPRRAVDTHLDRWLTAREASGELRPGQPFPVYLVAAEGGGIRAAYWAGIVLAKLQDDSERRFGRQLFAISGVSGGSLAAGAFAALVAEDAGGTLDQARCARDNPTLPYQQCMRALLRRDYLSPVLGFLLYPDMLQRFLPYPLASADRARAMEQGWGEGWRQALGSDRFAQRFDTLWRGEAALQVPSLLLNATLVNGGNRLIASDLVIDGHFPDAYDAFDPVLDLRQMSLATAVHNSARFSYVSPAGTVSGCGQAGRLVRCGPDVPRHAWGRVIDGGYFENSGVESLRDLLFAMRPTLASWSARGFLIEPVVIVISNSPDALAPSGRQDPAGARLDITFLSELLAPPLGLFNTRTARATFAVTAERRDMQLILPADPDRFLWFGMRTENETPLGWALADRTFDGMDALLRRRHLDALPFGAVLRRLDRIPESRTLPYVECRTEQPKGKGYCGNSSMPFKETP